MNRSQSLCFPGQREGEGCSEGFDGQIGLIREWCWDSLGGVGIGKWVDHRCLLEADQ